MSASLLPPPAAVRATAADTARLVDTLARAFVDDPIYDWLISGDKARLRPLFQAYLSRLALKHEETFMTPDGLGASLWAPPDGWQLGLREEIGFLPDWVKVIGLRHLWSRWRAVEMIQRHHPLTPHWYLMVIGIAPEVQGMGRSRVLFEPVLSRCDETGMPAYLETAVATNVPVFRRYGFEVMREVKVADGPLLWLMWREPKGLS